MLKKEGSQEKLPLSLSSARFSKAFKTFKKYRKPCGNGQGKHDNNE